VSRNAAAIGPGAVTSVTSMIGARGRFVLSLWRDDAELALEGIMQQHFNVGLVRDTLFPCESLRHSDVGRCQPD
jgi:hypothetical protein